MLVIAVPWYIIATVVRRVTPSVDSKLNREKTNKIGETKSLCIPTCIAVSPDRSHLVVGRDNGTLQILAANDLRQLHILKQTSQTWTKMKFYLVYQNLQSKVTTTRQSG